MKDLTIKLTIGGIICLFLLAGIGSNSVNGAKVGDTHHLLVERGITYYKTIRTNHGIDESQQMLKNWFLRQPSVKKVTIENRDMTIEFDDGHKVVILGHTEKRSTWGKPPGTPGNGPGGGGGGGTAVNQIPSKQTALILDPFDWEGGVFHNPGLMSDVEGYLGNAGYSYKYLSNDQVTLDVIENDLANYGVIYNRGHGGTSGRTVIISTGEHWTSSTTSTYSTEYNNDEIVEVAIQGLDGKYYYFIAYTPKLIEDHYTNLPNSLVYMESCESMKFSTMGDAYVGAGAGAYMGWDKSVTVNYGDDSADKSFQMFSTGSSVDDVANAIGPDPRTHANLKYVGAGDLGLVM